MTEPVDPSTDLVADADADASAAAGPVVHAVRPTPTDAELAAIMAAVEVAWPRPGIGTVEPDEPARWRFSGRWWSRPVPTRRDRP